MRPGKLRAAGFEPTPQDLESPALPVELHTRKYSPPIRGGERVVISYRRPLRPRTILRTAEPSRRPAARQAAAAACGPDDTGSYGDAGSVAHVADAASVGKSSKGPARSTDAPVKDAHRSGVPCVMTIRSAVGRISAPRRRFPRLQKAASMRTTTFAGVALIIGCLLTLAVPPAVPEEPAASAAPKAFIDGTGPGWRTLGEADFVNVNTDPDTWTWKGGGVHCTGKPV